MLRTSKDRKLLFMNKDYEVISTMSLFRDRILSRFEHRFIGKILDRLTGPLTIRRAEFLGNNTLVVLLKAKTWKIGVIKYRSENRKVLLKNFISLGGDKVFNSMHVCPKDRYLCLIYQERGSSENDYWIEIYELSPRLNSLKVVTRCLFRNSSHLLIASVRIISYIGKDERYGVIFGAASVPGSGSLNFLFYLFDTVEKKVKIVVKDGEIMNQGFELDYTRRVCQNKYFLLSRSFDFLKFEFTLEGDASSHCQKE